MKNITRFLDSININYKVTRDGIIINLGYDVTWINKYNELMKQKATITIYKLESYKYNNYATGYTYAYNMCKCLEHKTFKNVIEYLKTILESDGKQ